MNADDMKTRTRAFALRVIRLAESLPPTSAAEIIRKQIIRCGTSVGANYRAACRAKSKPDFIAKLGIVEEETDESIYWMELMIDVGLVKQSLLADLMREAEEILAIVVSTIKKTKDNLRQTEVAKSQAKQPPALST